MFLSIILSCIIPIKAGELVAPGIEWRTLNEVSMQLLFSKSHGVVKTLPDKAFSATDISHEGHPAHKIRIGSTGYWAGKKGGINAVTVDMMTSLLVTGVATEGIHSKEFVTEYSVMTSQNGFIWTRQGSFVGNFDEKICKVQFKRPVRARFVKFTVVKYVQWPAMRVDVLVYDMDQY
jgi:hypothetical protein